MTQFENLELLYKQFFNLADEIKSLIEKEEYNDAIAKLMYKDKLMKRLSSTKKTVNFTEDDREKLHIIEQKLQEKEQENIKFLSELRGEIGEKLSITKKKFKVSSAYTIESNKNSGVFVDVSE